MPMVTIGYIVPKRVERETIPHRSEEATMEARVMRQMLEWDEAIEEWDSAVVNDTLRD